VASRPDATIISHAFSPDNDASCSAKDSKTDAISSWSCSVRNDSKWQFVLRNLGRELGAFLSATAAKTYVNNLNPVFSRWYLQGVRPSAPPVSGPGAATTSSQ